MLIIKQGNLLDATEQYIGHQANCTSQFAAGIAEAIFKKFPYSNIYATRNAPSEPGTIDICGNGKDKRFVINMFGQYYPGPSSSDKDSYQQRLVYFSKSLEKISIIPNLQSLALPFKISCGLAGGDWEDYLKMIEKFAETNEVVLYKL